MLEVLKRLTYLEARQVGPDVLESFFTYYIPAAQVRKEEDWNLTLAAAMGGECVLYIDGEPTALAIEVRNFPARGLQEPSLEKVVRGSRDGFIETLMVNVSLVRRRLKDLSFATSWFGSVRVRKRMYVSLISMISWISSCFRRLSVKSK